MRVTVLITDWRGYYRYREQNLSVTRAVSEYMAAMRPLSQIAPLLAPLGWLIYCSHTRCIRPKPTDDRHIVLAPGSAPAGEEGATEMAAVWV